MRERKVSVGWAGGGRDRAECDSIPTLGSAEGAYAPPMAVDPFQPEPGPITKRLEGAAAERAMTTPSGTVKRTTEPPATMSLGEHLDELRRRLIFALAGLGAILAVTLFFGKELLSVLTHPFRQALREAGFPDQLQQLSLFETFGAYFKISMVAALVVGFPWVVWQAWKFVAPGLYRHERRSAYVLVPMSIGLSALGATFMFTVVLPVLIAFFVNFADSLPNKDAGRAPLPAGMALTTVPVLAADPEAPAAGTLWVNSTLEELRVAVPHAGGVQVRTVNASVPSAVVPQLRMAEVVGTVLSMALAFAAGFQTPVVVLLLGWVGIITPAMIAKYRKHAVMVIAVVAAVASPGADPFTMLLLATPLYVLFEMGVLLLRILPANKVLRDEPGDLRSEAGGEGADGAA